MDSRAALIERLVASGLDTPAKIARAAAIVRAPEMLKRAAEQLRSTQTEIEQLKQANERLTLEVIARERARRAFDLASEMAGKGLIKRADLQSQVDRLMEMDDAAFEAVKTTVAAAPGMRQAPPVGLETLAGIAADDAEPTAKAPADMQEAVIAAARESA